MQRWLPVAAMLAAAIASPALAHEISGKAGGFASGFTHPILGPDHIVAMIAVGLWGTQLGKPAIWLLPVTFPIVMAFGGVLGVRGMPLPGVEYGIALSGVTMGLLIAVASRPPLWIACTIVGIFAIFHGHAHGAELPRAASPIWYGIGFVLATGMLHLTGIALGLLEHVKGGRLLVRGCGAAIGCAGVVFLVMCFTRT
jgi:urease accessory protein